MPAAVADLVLLPAVDVAGGQAVQLVQGRAGSEKRFGDPRAAAQRWQDAGAEWIHLVDLDAAFGRGHNAEIIAEVTASRSGSTWSSPAASATTRPWNVRWPPAAPGSTSAPRRWSSRSGAPRSSAPTGIGSPSASTYAAAGSPPVAGPARAATCSRPCDRLDQAGCARFVVTDVNSDGMLTGPNLDLLRRVCEETDKPVVASGGISTLDRHLTLCRAMVPLGVEGAIIGTALYVGKLHPRRGPAGGRVRPTTESSDA